jgi:thiamine pyrophosphokinase
MSAPAGRRALVLADGDVAARTRLDDAWPGWSEGIDLVVAADGGARHAAGLGLTVGRWVGDGDSVAAGDLERLRAAGTPIELSSRDKEESDTELAVVAAAEMGADEITILGAFGGPRLDHGLANVALLAHPVLIGRSALLLSAEARVRMVRAPGPDGGPVTAELSGRVGDLVSILPFGVDGEHLSTSGLRYPLFDEKLVVGSARGLSNVRLEPDAVLVVGSGLLLIIETPATLSR